MAAPFDPLAIAETVGRNIVPVAGILFFGWQATSVLALYLIDTLLMMTVIFAGVARAFAPPTTDDGWAAQLNGEVGNVVVPLFLTVFIAIPIGVPLIFMTGGDLPSLKAAVGDSGRPSVYRPFNRSRVQLVQLSDRLVGTAHLVEVDETKE